MLEVGANPKEHRRSLCHLNCVRKDSSHSKNFNGQMLPSWNVVARRKPKCKGPSTWTECGKSSFELTLALLNFAGLPITRSTRQGGKRMKDLGGSRVLSNRRLQPSHPPLLIWGERGTWNSHGVNMTQHVETKQTKNTREFPRTKQTKPLTACYT